MNPLLLPDRAPFAAKTVNIQRAQKFAPKFHSKSSGTRTLPPSGSLDIPLAYRILTRDKLSRRPYRPRHSGTPRCCALSRARHQMRRERLAQVDHWRRRIHPHRHVFTRPVLRRPVAHQGTSAARGCGLRSAGQPSARVWP